MSFVFQLCKSLEFNRADRLRIDSPNVLVEDLGVSSVSSLLGSLWLSSLSTFGSTEIVVYAQAASLQRSYCFNFDSGTVGDLSLILPAACSLQ
jgi:hypothetical protein